MTGAADMWDAGYTGAGVDVALIDSGVVPGRRPRGRRQGRQRARPVLRGSGLQWITAATQPRQRTGHLRPRHAHGRHHRRQGQTGAVNSATSGEFTGVAPDARIVSIKVADAQGRTDVSQAIAAIDWVISTGTRRAEHPGAEPVVRHRRCAELPARPARVRRRAGLAQGHRRRRRRRQRRLRLGEAQQPGLRPVRDRRRRFGRQGHGDHRGRHRPLVVGHR